jgi:hypothetical protein
MNGCTVELIRIVGFDSDGKSVGVEDGLSSFLNFDHDLELRVYGSKFEKIINLKSDALCCSVDSVETYTDVGSTLGRMALTGVAAGLFFKNKSNGFKGKAAGAALGDYLIRGAESYDCNGLMIILRDSSIIKLKINDNDFFRIKYFIGNDKFTEDAFKSGLDFIDLVERLVEDGDFVLNELNSDLELINSRVSNIDSLIPLGKNFDERDRLRFERKNLLNQRALVNIKINAIHYSRGRNPDHQFIAISENDVDLRLLADKSAHWLNYVAIIFLFCVPFFIYSILKNRNLQ